jgi:diguanylate cyclase (GGDEF)-like protein
VQHLRAVRDPAPDPPGLEASRPELAAGGAQGHDSRAQPPDTAGRAPWRFWAFRVLALVLFVAVLGAMVGSERGSQAKSRSDLAKRFLVRGTTAAGFVESYTGFVLSREEDLAEQLLSTEVVTRKQFASFLTIFGFGPAVLLDSTGRAIAIAPQAPTLIGADLARIYVYLRTALGGLPTVSNVVPSAADGTPTVALATPFDTVFGRRVVSGAFGLATQPMGIYLHHVLPYTDSVVYLVDQAGTVIVASSDSTGTLSETNPDLADAIARSDSGNYRSGNADLQFAVAPVGGTPWRLVMAVPESTLFHPISEADRTLPWVFLGAFALTGGMLLFILIRSREGRATARRDARTDPLTGIGNRRAIEESLHDIVNDRRRTHTVLGVLMVDIDHFKSVNDRLGHKGGDMVLREVTRHITACLRAEDRIGRWGGEEFVVLLPDSDLVGLRAVAERIRARVEQLPVAGERSMRVTISVGAALASTTDDAESVVAHADAALYSAKESGRNRCVVWQVDTGPLVPVPQGVAPLA